MIIQFGFLKQGTTAPTNFYTLANAANPNSEVNAATGVGSTTNCTVSSVSSVPTAQNGTYSIKHTVTTSGVASESFYSFSLASGQTYTIEMYGYCNTGNWDVHCYNWEGFTTTKSASYGYGTGLNTWVYRTMTVTTNAATQRMRVGATTAPATYLAIDNIIITQL
jgi:hypothetical protein